MLAGKNILVGVTGGIAVYKAVDLVSRLVKEKANVKVVMTENATEFVSPLTFRSITQQSVVTMLFNSEAPIEHISLADWCDMALIAPATANVIGKIASGIADDLLTTAIMATKSPVMIVPAMNVNMYENPIVQENIDKLEHYGYYMVPPDSGMLACGYEGKGRFPAPEEIMWFIKSCLLKKGQTMQDLSGKKVLITAGACRELIDPMRYLSNMSSGKMGIALARAAAHRGAEVVFIYADIREDIPYYIGNRINALTSEEMYQQTLANVNDADIIIMNAAVTDFKPIQAEKSKIKKSQQDSTNLRIDLQATTDILKEVYHNKRAEQKVVGFAAETDNIEHNAVKKLDKADFVIANDLSVVGNDNTHITIYSKNDNDSGKSYEGSKFLASHKILDRLID